MDSHLSHNPSHSDSEATHSLSIIPPAAAADSKNLTNPDTASSTVQIESELRAAFLRQRKETRNNLCASAQHIFTSNTHCCTLCNLVLPSSSFYPSNLQRSAFYCKGCCRKQAKTQAQKRRAPALACAVASGSPTADPSSNLDDTPPFSTASSLSIQNRHCASESKRSENMLNRLRRMCARPQNGGFRKLLGQPIGLGFGVRMTRKLLAYWRHRSALSAHSNPEFDVLTLCWLPWKSPGSSTLQPWEIIPVTRRESRRLCAIPRHLWQGCLLPDVFSGVEGKLADLQRVLDSPGPSGPGLAATPLQTL